MSLGKNGLKRIGEYIWILDCGQMVKQTICFYLHVCMYMYPFMYLTRSTYKKMISLYFQPNFGWGDAVHSPPSSGEPLPLVDVSGRGEEQEHSTVVDGKS